jgi:hypothetical protein
MYRAFAKLLASIASLAFCLYGQQASVPHRSLLASVETASPEQLTVKAPNGSFVTVTLEQPAIVMNATDYPSVRSDFSNVGRGDRVLLRGSLVSDDRFVAREVWSNIASFFGKVLDVKGNECDVLVSHDEGSTARHVIVRPDMLGDRDEPLPKRDDLVGRDVQVVGSSLPDGKVVAIRIISSDSRGQGAIIDGRGKRRVRLPRTL